MNAAGSAPNSSTAASWASWAVSSFTSKLAKISNKPDDAKETTESIGVSAGKPTDSPINKNESIIDRSTTPNSGSTATRLESMSIDAKQSSISGDSIDEWDPEAFGTLDEEGTQTIKKVTEGWDQDDDDEDWKDFENDPNPPKSDVKPLFASIHKTAVAKSSFGKMELAEDHEPEEYSYTSKKSDKKSTDDDLWASLGGSGLNLRSAAASCKSGRTQEDELFANLNQPVKKTTSRLQAGQKKRGPLKLGAQKM